MPPDALGGMPTGVLDGSGAAVRGPAPAAQSVHGQ